MEQTDFASAAVFSNNLILNIIFRNLQNTSDLWSTRRVCKIWHKESQLLIEPSVPVLTIEWETKPLLPCQRKPNPSIAEFMEYVNTVSPENVLFHHFILLDWNKSAKYQFISQQFWQTCGPLIKSLRIDKLWISPFEEDILPKILFEYTPNMESIYFRCTLKIEVPQLDWSTKYLCDSSYPYAQDSEKLDRAATNMKVDPNTPRNFNMKSFDYNHQDLNKVFNNEVFKQMNWAQIFYSYPCLKELSVSTHYSVYLEAIANVQQANPECLANLETLHIFDIHQHIFTEEHYKTLTALDIPPLKSLHLGLHDRISYATASSLLSKWKESLTNLTLGATRRAYAAHDDEDADVIAFQRFYPLLRIGFVNLIYLTIPSHLLGPTLDFLRDLPKLELLDITGQTGRSSVRKFLSALEDTWVNFCHDSLVGVRDWGFPFEIPEDYQLHMKTLFPKFIFSVTS